MEVPGLAEALAWEERTREEAYLGLCAPIAGVPVKLLTLRRLTFLLRARSAFFFGRPAGPEDVSQFLWIVSPRFRPRDLDGRALFLADLCAGDALVDLASTVAQIGDYLDAAFGDAPAVEEKSGSQGNLPVTSFAAALVDTLAREYGWSRREIMRSPLSVLYQQLRRIAQHHNPKAVFISRRSMRARGDWLRAMQAQIQHGAAQAAANPPTTTP